MARKTVTVIIDDLSGKQLPDGTGETISFSLDGIGYELDLDSKAAEELRSSLSPFVSAARRMSVGRRARFRRVETSAAPTAVRAWAAANGIAVSGRGRIPADVLSQYHAAGN